MRTASMREFAFSSTTPIRASQFDIPTCTVVASCLGTMKLHAHRFGSIFIEGDNLFVEFDKTIVEVAVLFLNPVMERFMIVDTLILGELVLSATVME